MEITIITKKCQRNDCLPLVWHGLAETEETISPAHCHETLLNLDVSKITQVGQTLSPIEYAMIPLFVVAGFAWLPWEKAIRVPILKALGNIRNSRQEEFIIDKTGYSLASITLSDKGAAGLREDESGPMIANLVGGHMPLAYSQHFILPDEKNALRGLMAELALEQGYDLICTTGGTGVGPRDITPEATKSLLDSELPGISQAMLMASMAKTPRAAISRACAGIIGKCLVINLPGSPKAVAECLEPILPALEHLLAKLNGDTTDCGGK